MNVASACCRFFRMKAAVLFRQATKATAMDYDQLASFIQVAKLQSFSRAAEKIYRTQPAISAQVRLLEQECGEKLFDRSGKRVLMTPAGEILYRYAEKMLAMHKEALQAIAELNQTPRG